jgi:hypothetical protein
VSFPKNIQGRNFFIIERRRDAPIAHLGTWKLCTRAGLRASLKNDF